MRNYYYPSAASHIVQYLFIKKRKKADGKKLLEISGTSLAFLDIKISTEDNGLFTSVYYKPTDSHNYLLYSSSHPSHIKNSAKH